MSKTCFETVPASQSTHNPGRHAEHIACIAHVNIVDMLHVLFSIYVCIVLCAMCQLSISVLAFFIQCTEPLPWIPIFLDMGVHSKVLQHADDLNLDYIKKNVKFSLQGTIPMNGEERKRERERERERVWR